MNIYWWLFTTFALLCDAQGVPSSGCTLKSSPATGDICGVAGYAPKFAERRPLVFKQQVSSTTECADLCLRQPVFINYGYAIQYRGCTSFWFDSSANFCYYVDDPLLSLTEDPSSSKIFYNRTCFDCPASCPQTVGENLLTNPGFELSRHYLAPWKARKHGSYQGHKHGGIILGGAYGNSSQAYGCNDGRGQACYIAQGFNGCAGTIYEIGFDYKIPSTDGIFSAAISTYDSYATLYVHRTSPNEEWSTYTSLMTSTLADDMLKWSYTGVVDNFRIIPTNYGFVAKPKAKEVVVNGGFETGSLDPWMIEYDSYPTTVESQGIGSTYALKFEFPLSLSGTPSFDLVQNFTDAGTTVVPGTPYLFSFDYSSNVPNLTISVDYGLKFATYHKNMDYVELSGTFSHEGQKGTASTAFMGQLGSDVLTMIISMSGYKKNTGNGVVYFDNISIKELATPA